ncbi:hypothetical protein AOLI_G00328530 [Acnodon oligacanthus]
MILSWSFIGAHAVILWCSSALCCIFQCQIYTRSAVLLKCHVLLSGGEVGAPLLGYQQHRSESQGQTLRLQDVRESPPSYPGPLGLVGRMGSLCQKSTGDSLAVPFHISSVRLYRAGPGAWLECWQVEPSPH